MNDTPLISVITAVRNGAPYLRQLIESVLQQDYPNIEHIIIDDGSDDNGATVAVLKKYSHLRWWSRPNKGQYATQNEGIEAAQGDIICIISADDVYASPETFSLVVSRWHNCHNCQAIYGKTLQMDETGSLLPYQVDITGQYPQWFLKYYLYIQHCSLFVSRKFIVDNKCWFDPSFKYAGDWEWILKLSYTGLRVEYFAQPLAVVRIHHNQTSKTATSEVVMQEHKKVCQIYGSNYDGHVFLRKIFQYRAMGLIAVTTWRDKGFNEFVVLGKDWARRKYAGR